jgi:S-formylglutathione hydrolase FrmB
VYWRRRVLALTALTAFIVAGWAVVTGVIEADKHGAGSERFVLSSRALGRTVAVRVVVPADGAKGRPLLIYLHGRNGDENSERRNQALFDGLAAEGKRAPVVAFPAGGRDKYWHDRRSGRWGRWLTADLIPAVTRRYGTDSRRVAIGGTSMGGFGALDVARLHPGRFCAVGAHSPAIWRTGGETAPGAFDDARDFARHDLVGAARTRPRSFAAQPVWIDAGRSDPFQPGDRAFVAALQSHGVRVHDHLTSPGGHNDAYWHKHWRGYLDFYAGALARCRR